MSGRTPDETAEATAETALAESEPESESDAEATAPTVSATPRPAELAVDLGLPVVAREHYEVLGEHDRGGLGRIVRARDTRTGRLVAIKEMLPGRSDAGKRFRREALITANLQHPAIVPVYEVGQWESGEPFYAMKLVAGCSLDEAITDASELPGRLALLGHIVGVADAMAYAHAEGVIHRDLKPANVLVGSFGETVVIDWGLAKRIGDSEAREDGDEVGDAIDSQLTRAGSVVGTPAYMSPEQASGEPLDERSDVYAVGAMIYHLLTGRRPYNESKSVEQLLAKLLDGPPAPIDELVDDAPAELVAIAEKAMAHKRSKRYRTAGELADELRKFQTGKLVSAHSYTTWQLVQRWLIRHKAAVAVAAVAMLLVAVLGTISIKRVVDERDRADAESTRARRAERQAVTRLASLYAARGRQDLDHGRYDQAAVYLSRAYALGRDSAGLRTLLSRAMAPLDRRARGVTIATGATVGELSFLRQGKHLLGNTAAGVRVWNAKTGADVATLPGAKTGVKGYAVSPDGQLIAAVKNDDALVVWDATTYKTLWSMPTTGGKRSRTPAFSHDSTMVAVATTTRGVDVFDARSGEAKHWLLEPTALSVAFAPDNARVLIGTVGTANLNVWSLASGERQNSISAGKVAVMAIHPVSDSDALVITDGKLQHWNYSVGVQRAELEVTAPDRYTGIALSPSNAAAIAWASDGSAVLWDVKLAQPLDRYKTGHTGAIVQAGMSADGQLVFSRGVDGRVLIRDRMTGGVLTTIAAARSNREGVAMHPSAPRIAVTTDEAEVAVVDHGYRRRFRRGRALFHHVNGLSVSADGKRAAITARTPSNALVDLDTGKSLGTLLADAKPPVSARFSKRGSRVAVIDASGRLSTYDARNGKRMATWQVAGRRMAISPDGTRVVAATKSAQVAVWRTDTGKRLWQKKPFDAAPTAFRFAPTGKLVAATSTAGHAAVLSVDSGEATALSRHAKPTFIAGFSADGTRVVTVSTDRVARVSDARSGKPLFSPAAKVVTADLHGPLLATGAMNGRVNVWDVASGKRVVSWQASTTPVVLVSFDDAGGRVLTSSQNGPVRIWDAATGAQLLELDGHQGRLIYATFAPGSQRVVAMGTGDAFHRVWDTSIDERSAEQIRARIACLGRYKLDGDRLVANDPDPSRCR